MPAEKGRERVDGAIRATTTHRGQLERPRGLRSMHVSQYDTKATAFESGCRPGIPMTKNVLILDIFAQAYAAALKELYPQLRLVLATKVDAISFDVAEADVLIAFGIAMDSPLWDMPNVIACPHIGGFFGEYEKYVMPIVTENMGLFLAGRYDEMRNLIPH
jgi:hypothetical protein